MNCVSCGIELPPLCASCHHETTRGQKRSFSCTSLSDGEGFNNRLVQRQRTGESISSVSAQVRELTIDDNNNNSFYGEPCGDVSMGEYAEELVHQASTIFEVVSSAIPCGEMIAKFFKIGEEIISLYNKAEHNKDICGFFTVRINAAICAVNNLGENKSIFIKDNFELFKEFISCMRKIRQYVSEISQLGKMKIWLKGNLIEQRFQELNKEFEGYMQSLKFTLDMQYFQDMSDTNMQCFQNMGDIMQMVAKDVREVREFLSHVKGGIADSSNQNISSKIPQVLNMNIGYQRRQHKLRHGSRDSIDSFELLDVKSFERTFNDHRKNITKRYNLYREEVAFKEFTVNSPKSEKEICQEVKILEHLSESQHIIRFYGVIKEESCYFLVTEWMENGNLLEFYERYPGFSWEKKFDFAIDICRGLIFLNAVRIFHHDLRGANMLVDKNHKVKVANFGLSRRFDEITRNIKTSLETLRYMAPEKLKKGDEYPYDIKCEIYSLGVLLWEIAEERIPYSKKDNDKGVEIEFATIRDHVINNRREPLSSNTPEVWQNVIYDALKSEPGDRPAISKIFSKLHEYHEITHQQRSSQPIVIEIEDSDNELDIFDNVNGMSVQDAINEHKKGNKQKAWECFSYHAENGDMHAKFWVGYYLYHSEIEELKCNAEANLIRAAQLFRETADNGKADGQLRYGTCLWLGKGVKTNYNEAIKYLTLAANNGNVNAMYNVGSAYYSGKGVERDITKGTKYLADAARGKNHKAIEMCKKYGINYF